MTSCTKWLCAAVVAAFMTSTAQAVIITTVEDYVLTGAPGSGTPPAQWNATTTAGGVTAIPLTRGAGIDPAALANGFSSNNWTITAGTAATAIAADEYFQFGFTAPSDGPVSITEFDANLRRSALDAPKHFALYHSFDGFATPPSVADVTFNYLGRSSGTAPGTITQYQWMTTDTAGQDGGNPIQPQDLSGIPSLQNIAANTQVTFRLYGWGDGGGAAASNTVAFGRTQGPKLLGEVVPEPASLSLVAFAMSAATLRRRRSR